MARHCVRWASGKKAAKGKKGKGKPCRFGKVKFGPRKGRCRARRVGRRKKSVNTAKRGRYIFHGR